MIVGWGNPQLETQPLSGKLTQSVAVGDKVNLPEVTSSKSTLQETIDSRSFLSYKDYKDGISKSYQSGDQEYRPLEFEHLSDISGAILPHHNIANVFLADFYKVAAKIHEIRPYDLVVVISPNHQSMGEEIQVVTQAYDTFEGIVASDKTLGVTLANHTDAAVASKEMIGMEHGQLIHMPYIRHYLKEVKVLSIVVKETGKDEGLINFVDELETQLSDKRILVIASIDFSHDLTLEEATKKDRITEELLMRNDTRGMFQLTDAYIDSPSSYLMFIELLERRGSSSPTITNQSNSALFLRRYDLKQTTSYFQVLYN